MAETFPLKYLKDVVKDVRKYMDVIYISDTEIRGYQSDPDALGEYIAFAKNPEKFVGYTPMMIDIPQVAPLLKDLKSKTLKCQTKNSSYLFFNDGITEVVFDIPQEMYKYNEFVEYVWHNLDRYNFTNITEDEMAMLNDAQAVELTAYFNDATKPPRQLIISGKDFNLSKSLIGISVAAVEVETAYQKEINHGHVVVRIEYNSVVIFLLCGVV